MKDIKRVVVVSYRKLICTMLALAFILSICLPGSFKVNAAGAKNVNEVLASNYSNTYLMRLSTENCQKTSRFPSSATTIA